jgi:hypothetical protein
MNTEFTGGQIVMLHSITGTGCKRYQLFRDGREHFGLRDEDGTARTKRYTVTDLNKMLANGLLSL